MASITLRKTVITVFCIAFFAINAFAGAGRLEQTLSGPGWRLSLDREAKFLTDKVVLPPVDLSKVAVNPPAFGWDKLDSQCDKVVSVPGTVEEHYWGIIGGANAKEGAGNYIGVSWWSRTFDLRQEMKGKKILLAFDCVNLRAEVFINHRLVGYDAIGNTPFTLDITDAVSFDSLNKLDVRITDPVGNFSWNDNPLMPWGDNLIPAVHGFGGITGKVVLRAVDPVYMTDIYVQNKPNPKQAEVFVTFANTTGKPLKGSLALSVHEWKDPAAVVFQQTVPVTVDKDGFVQSVKVDAPAAKLWELSPYRTIKEAALYVADVKFTSDDKAIADQSGKRFGFRYFTVGEKDGDKRFYLNGKRVFITAAMTRGLWPGNGIFATPEMAMRDMKTLVDMGFNMMLMHRAIGQLEVIEYADQYGLFTYEEPGGYRITTGQGYEGGVKESGAAGSEMGLRQREEKIRRMVIRDRSFPSMIIYNLKNEAQAEPDNYDIADIKMMHELDPSRVITYNSDRNRTVKYNEKVANDPFKLNMRPFDDTLYYDWWDQHHWFAFPGYIDFNYKNPKFYLRGVINAPVTPVPADSLNRLDPREIIFWGEEGAWGSMIRLGAIYNEFVEKGKSPTGYREMEHVDWYNIYDRFLDDSGYRASYPTVDALTLEIGRNLHYFHGRSLENIRMSNIADAANLNGWATEATRTDLIDIYRYPTGDPSILQHYSQPLYVAVKIREKSVPVGTSPIADFFIINELDLNGKAVLEVTYTDPSHKTIFTKSFDVNILGGEEFGQLLVEGVTLPAATSEGKYILNARIVQDTSVKCTGFDDIYAADIKQGNNVNAKIAVLETDNVVKNFLKTVRNITAEDYTSKSKAGVIIVGKSDKAIELVPEILKRAEAGATVIVINNAEQWADAVNSVVTGPKPFNGSKEKVMDMGRLFMNSSPCFAGLPQAQSMGWEYQFFYHYGKIQGLMVNGSNAEYIVAASEAFTPDIAAAIAGVKIGKGQIVLSSICFPEALTSVLPQSAGSQETFP